MKKKISIGNKIISKKMPAYIVAEMSANHNMDFNRAKAIIKAAANAGADAIKIQTYTQIQLQLKVINQRSEQKEYGKDVLCMNYMGKHIRHGNGKQNYKSMLMSVD